MIEKEYKVIELNNGKKDITIVFKNLENSELLTSFLYSDVIPFEDWIKADIDRVISGETDSVKINGNVCSAEVRTDLTKIYDNFIEDDEEHYSTFCSVDTAELRKLIDDWCEKVRDLKNDNRILGS